MDQVSEDRLKACHPLLQQKVRAATDACAKQGVYVRVNSGLRTYAEQDALFFACHHPNGTLDTSRPWKTNARGGYSNHNFGMAVDACPSLKDCGSAFDPCWDPSHKSFLIMVREMKAQGLAWGGDWLGHKDCDHFQLADVETTPTSANRTDYAKGGIQAVWASYKNDLPTSSTGIVSA